MDDRKGRRGKRSGPVLEVASKRAQQGGVARVSGSGWPVCPIELTIGGRAAVPGVVNDGSETGDGGLLPNVEGSFQTTLALASLPPGRHTIVGKSAHRSGAEARATVRIDAAPEDPKSSEADRPTDRARHFFEHRFGEVGAVPAGLRQVQVADARAARALESGTGEGGGGPQNGSGGPGDGGAQPVPGVCNWTPLGPSGVILSAGAVYSGRTLAVGFDPTNAATVYVGAAGGGVWKSTDGGENWSPKSDYQVSLAIGALAVDPTNPLHVLAGTGEYNNFYIGTYYGNGILRSDNGGDTWTEHGGSAFARAEISRIAFDPLDTTGQHVLLSSSVGVFESLDGGTSWSVLRAGDASDLTLFSPTGGAPNRLTAIAAFSGSGLWTATRQAGVWGAWTQLTGPAFPTTFDRIALTHQRSDPKVIYALFATSGQIAGMARTLDGSAWTKVDIRLNATWSYVSSVAAGHSHNVVTPAADLTAAPAVARTYTTDSAGSPAHTHQLALTAAQMATLAGGAAVSATTTADATGHQHTFTLAITAQSGYNLCVGVHPTDANTAYLGERFMWRTTTGGGTFDQLPVLHTDEHGFAFEPSGTACWMVGDGGVFRSTDLGSTWTHRNRDLATLEYIGLAQHPDWETVLIGGTQDNGTHRYTGSPAWRFVDGGDGGFAAIDPVIPTRMYHEYVRSTFYRSDDAGDTWNLTNDGISGPSNFYSPFVIDPSNHDVCYFGGGELWRRDYSVVGGTWSAVTSGLPGGSFDSITAIVVDPSDTTKLYAATVLGKVWRIQRTGATWAPADVTRTDISTGLPGWTMSDLAMDGAGVIWATVATVYYSEVSGEFSSDHVFRRAPGDTSWSSRSTGLTQANPVNSIVIDPTNPNRLFCGCDVGVFRTENAGGMWTPWDEGIPNVPVFDLVLHGPRRLLRAATHGRSIWERPIDALSCPMVDTYIRDDLVDSGRVQPTPSGVPSPLDPATYTYYWQSPDVKVDALEPTYQTPTPIGDYVSFEAVIVHRTARRNRVNRFYVQVHNRGISKATGVQVRGYFAAATGGLPALPSDFWSMGKPFVGTPGGTDWTPVGPALPVGVLEPGKPAVLEWDWAIPMSAPEHSCLLVVMTCNEEPLVGTGITNPDQLVVSRKQVGLKNLHVLDPVPGGEQPAQDFTIGLGNPDDLPVVADVHLHWGTLPRRSRVRALLDRGARVVDGERVKPTKKQAAAARKAARDFPRSVPVGCGYSRPLARDEVFELRGGTRAKELLLVDGVVIPPKGRRTLAVRVAVAGRVPPEGAQFDVVQRVDGSIVGGCTYRIERPPPKKRASAARAKPKR